VSASAAVLTSSSPSERHRVARLSCRRHGHPAALRRRQDRLGLVLTVAVGAATNLCSKIMSPETMTAE
jgi:hypothetical protein